MRRLLAALLLLMTTAPGRAATPVTVTLFEAYDVPSTSYNYCLWSDLKPGNGFIKTTGSSTTVDAVTASQAPFTSLGVGDEIRVRPGAAAAWQVRYVATATSATSVVVNTAANWENSGSGYGWSWRDRTCGTAATNGWVDVSGLTNKTVQLTVTTINATSLTATIEGRLCGLLTTGAELIAVTYTAADSELYAVPEAMCAIRVGWKLNTDTGAQSVTAYVAGE